MATQVHNTMPELALVGPGGRLPLDRRTIETLAEFFVGLIDINGPDTDLEQDDADLEPDGTDFGDPAWVEWHAMRGSQKAGPNIIAGQEDDEDVEGGGDTGDDENEPNFSKRTDGYGAGCPVSDSDFEHDGRELTDGY